MPITLFEVRSIYTKSMIAANNAVVSGCFSRSCLSGEFFEDEFLNTKIGIGNTSVRFWLMKAAAITGTLCKLPREIYNDYLYEAEEAKYQNMLYMCEEKAVKANQQEDFYGFLEKCGVTIIAKTIAETKFN